MSRVKIYCPALKRDAEISWFQDPAKITAPSKRSPNTPKMSCNDGKDRYDSSYYTDHSGLDFVGNRGDKIYAAHSGKVWIGQQPAGQWPDGSSYGATTYVVIIRPNGIQESYCHMDTTLVTSGHQVSEGQQIGTMGDKGKAQGVHLHYHAYRNDKGLDAYAALLGLYDANPDALMNSWSSSTSTASTGSNTSSSSSNSMPTSGSSIPDKEQYYPVNGSAWPTFTVGNYYPLTSITILDKPDTGKRVGSYARGETCDVTEIITSGVTGIWGKTKHGYTQLCNTSSGGTHRRVNVWRIGDIKETVSATTSSNSGLTSDKMPTSGSSVPDKEQYYKFANSAWPTFKTGEYKALVSRDLFDKAGGTKRVNGLKKGESIIVNEIITSGVPGIWGRTNFGYVQLGGSDSSGQYRVVWCWKVKDIPSDWKATRNW